MKKTIYILAALILLCGWSWLNKEKPAITIGTIKISKSEFETAYKKSPQAKIGKLDKKGFLDLYISRKLILKQAENLGLDKDPDFLQDVQSFWEQALLKRFLERKIKELALNIKVSEKEIRKYYKQNKEKLFKEKTLPEVYQQIKLVLLLQKQQKTLQNWINSLRKNTKVIINYQALGIEENSK